MNEILDIFKLLKELLADRNNKKEEEIQIYIDDIFEKTELILKNYMDIFSTIRINIISGKFNIDNVIAYLLEREYELKDVRVFLRTYLEDKYYSNDETKIKFVAAIFGIMECYPVRNGMIIDKTNHTINSYITFCRSLLFEDTNTQCRKILGMTDGILLDLTTSWKTACECYKELKTQK